MAFRQRGRLSSKFRIHYFLSGKASGHRKSRGGRQDCKGCEAQVAVSNHPEQVKLDPRLARCIKKGECVAFIGSGLSNSVYCDWRTLITCLCNRCGVTRRPGKESSSDDLLDLAEEAKSAAPCKYYAVLHEKFGHIGTTNPLYDILMRLNFKSYVTTNFDPLLAHEARKPEHNMSVEVYPSLSAANINRNPRRTVFYIHGLIKEGATPAPMSIVLSRSEFHEAYRGTTLSSFLEQLLTFHPVCFLGCTLDEHPLKNVFEECSDIQSKIRGVHGGPCPERFILLAEQEEVWVSTNDGSRTRDLSEEQRRRDAEERQYEHLGIQIVRYFRKNDFHSGLRHMLERESSLLKRAPTRLGLLAENIV